MRLAAALLACLVPGAALAQAMADAPGAVLRGLDKMAGTTADLTLENGAADALGPLTVTVDACRYPADNPAADAFAHLTISDAGGAPLFKGWMEATSPALSALDHPRYDIWVLRCILPEGAAPAASAGDAARPAPKPDSTSGG